MNIWQFHLLNWQGVGPICAIFVSFVYTGLIVWAFLQSHNLNLTYCFKSSVTCILCVKNIKRRYNKGRKNIKRVGLPLKGDGVYRTGVWGTLEP